jgi:hypothetical protein
MRAWILARLSGFCGRCGEHYEAGDRVLELSGKSWRLIRCVNCGSLYGEAEDRTQPEPPVSEWTRLKDVEVPAMARPRLVRDWKSKAAVDIE